MPSHQPRGSTGCLLEGRVRGTKVGRRTGEEEIGKIREKNRLEEMEMKGRKKINYRAKIRGKKNRG